MKKYLLSLAFLLGSGCVVTVKESHTYIYCGHDPHIHVINNVKGSDAEDSLNGNKPQLKLSK